MEEVKVDSVQPETTASGVTQETVSEPVEVQSTKDSVAYDTYKRTLAEAKKAKARAAELEERTVVLEQEKLASEGKKDELIASLKGDLEKTKGKVGSLAYANLEEQVKAEAAKFGCIDADLLVKAVDLRGVDIDSDTLRGDLTEIKTLVEEVKQSKPHLFAKTAPRFADGVPAGSGKKFSVDIDKMTQDELRAHIEKNFK